MMRAAATLLVLLSSAACSDEAGHRLPPLGDGDADADADGDTDADADADADTDADADGDPTHCALDEDCVVVVQLDLCCACPRAVSTAFDDAEPCLTPWPAEGDPPPECVVPCERVCDACAAPDGALCIEGVCTVHYPGVCVTRDDCEAGQRCVEIDGQSVCEDDPSVCVDHAECAFDEWCGPTGDGQRRCRALDPGQCAWDGNCDPGEPKDDPPDPAEVCEGATPDTLGRCVGPH